MGIAAIIIGAIALYFAPSIVAINKRGGAGIAALNTLLGWTLIGWVAALVWALAAERVDQGTAAERIKISTQRLSSVPPSSVLQGTRLLLRQSENSAGPTWLAANENGTIAEIDGSNASLITFKAEMFGKPVGWLDRVRRNGKLEIVIDFMPHNANPRTR